MRRSLIKVESLDATYRMIWTKNLTSVPGGYKQSIMVWNIAHKGELPKAIASVQNALLSLTDEIIKCCTVQSSNESLDIPQFFSNADGKLIWYKSHRERQNEKQSSMLGIDDTSLILQKTYHISWEHFKRVASIDWDREDLPMALSEEEMEIVRSPDCSFILGRSGSGKV